MTVPTTQVFARGVNKILAYQAEAAYGVVPPSPAGQQLRRITSNFTLGAPLIPSAEILASQQVRDSRQGPRAATGTLAGQLSPGTYKDLFCALLRMNNSGASTFFQLPQTATLADLLLNTAGGTLAPMAYQAGSAATVIWPSGTGLWMGDPIKFTGLGSPNTADNGIPLLIQSFNGGATYASVYAGLGQPSLVSPFTGQSGKIAGVGKAAWIPNPGATTPNVAAQPLFPSFTFEEYFTDVGISDVYNGVVPTQAQISMPARGFCTFNMSFLGQNQITSGSPPNEGSSQFFASAAPPTTSASLMMIGGAVMYKGNPLIYMSSANLSISCPAQADPMMGVNYAPNVFLGPLSVTGSFTTLMTPTQLVSGAPTSFVGVSDTLTQDFLDENEVSLSFLMATANSPTADFILIYMPRVKLGAAGKQDSQTAITRAFTFQAMENAGQVPNARDTTMTMYDSAA